MPDMKDVLTAVFKKELSKPVEEMNPVFIDLLELLVETLSSYGVQLDFFTLADSTDIEPADECESLLIKVL